jgi:hypothetical protein
MNETLFEEYEPVKDIMRIGQYALVKYQKPIKEKKKGITNERQSIVKQFVDELNKERDVTKYKPYQDKYIAVKLGVLKTNQELYEFLSECRDYKNRNGSFGKRFFGGFKEKSLT